MRLKTENAHGLLSIETHGNAIYKETHAMRLYIHTEAMNAYYT